MNKPILHISFSGGLTSGYMTHWLMQNYSDVYEFIITFANTGLEKNETLDFVNNCDKYLGFKTVWLESVVHHEHRVGTTHKIISYETATRNHTLFENMIEKYGIPNMVYKHCTRELKIRPMNSYLRSLGLKPKDIPTAIGIRDDESRRCSKDAENENLIYPLVDWKKTTKEEVHAFWAKQDFTLGLEEHDGNCIMCFEKSFPKLMKQLDSHPELLEFHLRMEKMHGQTNNREGKPNRVFFRQKHSALDLMHMQALNQMGEAS